MKNIYKIALLLVLFLSVNKINAQMGCLQPPSLALGVFDATTGAAMSSTIPCTYTNLINIYPNPFAIGNNGTSPCIRIIIGLTNPNAAINNSIAIGQGTNTNIYDMCPVACNTIIPSNSSYTMSLFFANPAQSYGYNLCNTNIAGNMNYTVASCYNSTPLASGVWNNSVAGGCQTVTIPANSNIGSVGYTVAPAIAPTASFNANQGDLFLDTYQMAQGIYTITYSFNSGNGCTAITTRTISITNPFVSTWTAVGPLCANGACVNLPPQVTGTAGGTFTAPAGVSSNSFCPSLVGAGSWPVTYTVGLTPQCGNSTNNNIVVNPVPTANAGPTQSLTCSNTTTTLAGSGGGTYSWTGPSIISGNTTANPVVGGVGVYSLTVSSGGCTSSTSTVAVGTNTTPPSPTAGTSASVTCTNSVINLTSNPAGMSYTWTAPAGSSITGGVNIQNTTGSGPGTYTVRVLNPANGCFATTTVAAQINTVAPITSAGTSGSITCNNNSINLTSTLAGATYTWIAPGGSSITGGVNNQNTTGSGAGTYSVRVQSAVNGCTAMATVAALVNTVNPSPTAGTSASVTCTNSVINLTSNPSGMSYTWTAPAGSSITGGVNNQNTTGSGPGTYSVRVTDAVNGCTNIATVAALINTVAPTGIGASASTSVTCISNTVNLNGSPGSGVTYTWTAPAGSSITGGVNSQNTTGQGAGIYSLTIQSSLNGCTANTVTTVGFNTVAPSGATANSSGTVTCASSAVNLGVTIGGGPYTYSWTAPPGSSITSGGTSSSATGSGGGTYSVVVTGTNGCSGAAAVVAVNTNTTAPTQTAIPTQSLTCSTTSVNITGNPSSGVLYSWLGTGIVGPANQSTVNVVLSGNYTLVVTSTANSCTSSAVAAVGTNTTPPNALGSGSVNITCATPSVTLIGSANPSSCTVVWTGGVCAGANSYTATACSAGTYSMTVTNPANGCSSSPATFTVVPDAASPTATLANTATITCLNTSAQIIATPTTTAPVTYTWSGPGIVSGSSTSTVTVNQGGVYTLTLTNLLNSCTSVITNSVTNDNAPVTPTVAASNTITCNTTTINMTATVGAGTYTYNWSGPGIVGTNTLSSATSSLGGTYNVTVTNTSNGCVGTATLTVNSSTTAPTGVSINPPTFTLSCSTPTTVLTATAVGASTYSWIAPATGAIISGGTSATAGINGPGNYSVVVTGTNGCSAAAAISAVSPNTLAPTFVLSNSSPSITCLTASPTVSVNITSSVAIGSYSWSPASGISGSTTGSVVTFTTAGTYTGVITATNGCQSNAIVTVADATTSPTFVAGTATASPLSCSNPTTIISPAYTPTTDITFVWSGPGIVGSTTGSSVSVNQNGTYSVIVTNTITGCASNSLTVIVVGTTIPPLLNVSSTSSVGLGCSPTNSTNILTANATPTNVSYSWNTTATTPTILVTTAGVYTVTITDPATSCTTSVTYTVDNNTTVPTATSVANTVIPCGATTATLNGGSPDPGVIFSWTGPSIISGSNTSTPVVDQPGTYILTVTNPTTGCSSTSTVTLINGVPTASFTPDVTTGFAPQVVNFTNLSSPSATVFTWTFGDGNSSSTTSPSNTYSVAGSYTVMMIASSGLCSDTAYAFITIEDGFSIEIPNVFTPNDDNVNDVFTIKSTGVKEIQLQIFNRWGQLMYDFTGAKAAWDGITNAGEKATDGTYFYFVIATGFDGKEVKKNGSLGVYR